MPKEERNESPLPSLEGRGPARHEGFRVQGAWKDPQPVNSPAPTGARSAPGRVQGPGQADPSPQVLQPQQVPRGITERMDAVVSQVRSES